MWLYINLRGNVRDQNVLGNLAYIFLIICCIIKNVIGHACLSKRYIYYVRIQERSTILHMLYSRLVFMWCI